MVQGFDHDIVGRDDRGRAAEGVRTRIGVLRRPWGGDATESRNRYSPTAGSATDLVLPGASQSGGQGVRICVPLYAIVPVAHPPSGVNAATEAAQPRAAGLHAPHAQQSPPFLGCTRVRLRPYWSCGPGQGGVYSGDVPSAASGFPGCFRSARTVALHLRKACR